MIRVPVMLRIVKRFSSLSRLMPASVIWVSKRSSLVRPLSSLISVKWASVMPVLPRSSDVSFWSPRKLLQVNIRKLGLNQVERSKIFEFSDLS